MNMITITRRLEFDAAHRVKLHESKCRNLHGHRYAVEITMTAPELDPLGRVVDFAIIKEKLGHWIDTHWDHQTILWDKDRHLGEAISEQTEQDVYYLPYNPTVENLAIYLFDKICPELFMPPLQTVSVRIWETPNCSAEAHRER